MSFELYAFVDKFPVEIITNWKQKLIDVGLVCEFHPDFQSIDTWSGGILPIKVKFSEKYADRYGLKEFLAEIELYVEDDLSEYEWILQEGSLPEPVKHRLAQSKKMAFFSTSTGRNMVDLHLQCFAAAALVFLCDGVLYNPQSEGARVGNDVFEGAQHEIEAYEPSKSDLQFRYFQSWDM